MCSNQTTEHQQDRAQHCWRISNSHTEGHWHQITGIETLKPRLAAITFDGILNFGFKSGHREK